MKLKGGPPALRSRRRSKTRSASHHARISSSSARWSGYWGSDSNTASILGTEQSRVRVRFNRGTTGRSVKERTHVYNRDRTELRTGSAAERQAGDRRLLGGMVRPVPRRLAGARQDRRRAQRRPEARQGQHRRGAGARHALRRSVDPDDDPLQGGRAHRSGSRRPTEGRTRKGPWPFGVARHISKGWGQTHGSDPGSLLGAFGHLFLWVRHGRRRSRAGLLHEVQDAHPMHVDDRASEPAAERQHAEADQREDERAGADVAVRVRAVSEDRGEREEDGRGHHGDHVRRGRLPQLAPPLDRQPVRESGERRWNREDESGDERDPPAVRAGVLRDAQNFGERRDRRERVCPDRRVGQWRVNRMAGKPAPQIAELHVTEIPRSPDSETLRVVRLEETQKRRVLGEEGFDLGDACAGPVLDPRVAEIVLDVMKAAFAHARKYRHAGRTAPWAVRLIRGTTSPILRP